LFSEKYLIFSLRGKEYTLERRIKRVNVEEGERLCGYVTFDGVTSPNKFVAGQKYVFSPEDRLKGIVVYARGNKIDVELYQ
jgi:hypothetical protein